MSDNVGFKGVIKTSYTDSTPWWPESKRPPEGAPNILYVVLDDTGYSQLGCYGSLVPTPNMDSIAADGLRYSDFHVCALCSPTRASLLTGCNSHTVGFGYLSALDLGFPALSGRIDSKYGLLSETLQDSGYSTFCVGKWHLCNEVEMGGAGPFEHWPLGRGFDKFYGFMNGATSQFNPDLIQDNSIIDPPKTPEEGYHLSEDLVDRSIKYISTEKAAYPDKPFFCYLSFGAMHAPYHAPREYIDKFKGTFDEGYDAYRKKVFERQKEMGLIPENAVLSEINDMVEPWDSLNDWEKKVFARYMEVFAGFLNYTDEQLGRLLDYLKKIGQYDNTLIVLVSDNGASAEGGSLGSFGEQYHMFSDEWPGILSEDEYERIGGPESYSVYPTGWAWAGNTPLKWYKSWVHGGGIKVPCIISCPDRIKDKGGIRNQYHFVTDLYTTVLDICGIKQPEYIKGVQQEAKPGISMTYSFDDKNAPRQRHVQYYAMEGNRGIWCDGWKAVANHVVSPSFDEDQWELYHTDEDFSETLDLADKYPEKLKELIELWWREAGEYGVLPLTESHFRTRDGFKFNSMFKFAPSEHKSHYIYYPEMDINAPIPHLTNKSFKITVKADYQKGDQGVLYSCGYNMGGYVLYVENGKLHFNYNYLGARSTDVSADAQITEGEHEFAFDFMYTQPGKGVGRVLVDGSEVGRPVAFADSLFAVKSGLGVGRYATSSVERSHKSLPNHFAYTGKIDRADIELDRLVDDMDLMLRLEQERQSQ